MKIFILLLALGLCLADAVPGGYQQIDTTEAQADPTIQSYIQTGLNAVVQNAINKGFFSNSDFALASINSVAEQVVNGANYKFDCNFTDSKGVVIQANFVVHQSATTDATTVTSYAYKVYYPATTTTTTTTTTTPNGTPTTTVETEEDISAVEEEESGESGENAETESGENAEAESGESDTTTTTTVVTGQADTNSTTETSTTTTTDADTNSTETSTEASVNTTAPVTNETAVVSPDGFTAISADEFSQSDDLRKYFTFGFENVVQNGIISGKIPNTTFSSAKVLGAASKTVKNGEIYKFTAEASNGDNVELELGFQVSLRVPSYSYKVKITTTVPSNGDNGSGDNSTTPVDTGAGSDNNSTTPGSGSDNNSTTPVDNDSGSDNNSTIPVDNGSGSDNNSTTPVDTNTTTPVDTNTTTPAIEWTAVDLVQAQQNAEIQSNLAQGFNQVIQTVVQKKLLAADNYTISQVVAVSYHNLTKGVNYKFTVKANNDDQTFFMDLNFTTYYRYSNQSVKTVSYHYNYYTRPAPVQNNTTPAQNNTTPAQNNTTPAQNNTTPAQNNTTPAQNNTNTNNGYVALSDTEIQAQDVQNAINYGSNQVVQLGIQKNKIPNDTYNITQVASVLKKIQPSGANYNATVTLKSAANVTVNTNFNVYYNSTSNAMILKAYSYGVTGIKKNNN